LIGLQRKLLKSIISS